MLSKYGLAAITAAFLGTAGWAWAAEIEVLKRTGPWVVDYDRDACHLIAQFGTGDAAAAVRFSRYRPSGGFDLAVYGNRVRSSGPNTNVKIDFGLGGKPFEATGMNGTSGALPVIMMNAVQLDGRGVKFPTKPDISPEQEASVTGVTVTVRNKPSFRMEFGPLDKPFAQLRDCTTKLVRSWGYDPDVQAALSRRAKPTGSPENWLRGVYPSEASRRGHQGVVKFRLDLDPQGKVVGCAILARTDPDEFADATCKAMSSRAQFDPALDALGAPVRSYYMGQATYIIPR